MCHSLIPMHEPSSSSEVVLWSVSEASEHNLRRECLWLLKSTTPLPPLTETLPTQRRNDMEKHKLAEKWTVKLLSGKDVIADGIMDLTSMDTDGDLDEGEHDHDGAPKEKIKG